MKCVPTSWSWNDWSAGHAGEILNYLGGIRRLAEVFAKDGQTRRKIILSLPLWSFCACLGWCGQGNGPHNPYSHLLQKSERMVLEMHHCIVFSISSSWFQPGPRYFVVNISILTGFLFSDVLLGLSAILEFPNDVSTVDFFSQLGIHRPLRYESSWTWLSV